MPALFRLREALVAVPPPSDHGLSIITIPHNSIVEIVGEPERSGLVEVLWNGKHIAVFLQDIEARCESVDVAN